MLGQHSVRGLRVGDLSAKYGMSTGQNVSGWVSLHGDFLAGGLSDADVEDLGPQPTPARVAFGKFTASDAAIGLIAGLVLMVYLGSRVVVEVKK